MWRILIIVSVVPLALAIAARWWFGLRVLTDIGSRVCRRDLDSLPAGSNSTVQRSDATALEFGRQLRKEALATWAENDPKSARARENSRRFGMAVPPLCAVVAIFAVIVAKIPIVGACALVVAATSLSCAIGLLSLPPELQAIGRAAQVSRNRRDFPSREDEDAVMECAMAHAWMETLPPVIGLFQR